MPCGLREWVPPVWCGAINTSAPSSAVARTFSTRLLSQQIKTPTRTPGGIEHRVAVAAGDSRVFEGVQFTVHMQLAVRQTNGIGVVATAVVAQLDQPDADRHVVTLRQRANARQRRAARDRLRQRAHLGVGQMAHVPIAGDAHFREGQQLYLLLGRLRDKAFHGRQVVILIVGAVLELHRGGAQ